jgi:ABC-type bacteriocin/lantibiotic exporter with double-glycine peptidase domain
MGDEAQSLSQPSSRSRLRRRWFAPEVIQTSAMDCGPAALKCLLAGFDVSVSYGRLREACQTSVDGTSIDTLEAVARLLGLDAEQIMLPPEHVVAPGADALPAIAVVRLPNGMTHFVVLWRRWGPYLQVMDPGRGRRWVRASTFLRDLLVHTQAVDADAFQAFAIDPGFTGPLKWRVEQLLGARRARALAPLFADAAADPSWRAIAGVDGATRAVEALVNAGVLRRGAEAATMMRALSTAADSRDVREAHASARMAPGGSAPEQVLMRGAILVRVAGRLPSAAESATDDNSGRLPPELEAARGEAPVSVWKVLTALWTSRAKRSAWVLGIVALLAAGGTMTEVALTRPLLSVSSVSSSTAGFVALCILVLGLVVVELPLAFGTRALGRALDLGLRRAFLRKLPLLGDRYFSSRPVSDMAERAHLLHRVRLLPSLVGQLGRCAAEMVLMTGAIAWLYPPGAPLAVALLLISWVVPLVGMPVLTECDLRLRTHSGSLMRFYLDALLGLTAVRTHGAEQAIVREHDQRLQEWRRAGRDMVRTALSIETIVVLVVALGAGVLVARSFDQPVARDPGVGNGLLLLFFALGLPSQAARLIGLWRQLPDHRNVTLRLIEPLGAPEERAVSDVALGAAVASAVTISAAASVRFEDVSVHAGGHPVLTDVSLEIPPGAHVAIVGASGAGKSSLLGVLLGFHRPVAGRAVVDGRLPGQRTDDQASAFSETAWVEPGVQLWNRSLRDNVAYGTEPAPSDEGLARAIADAELTDLVARLPHGLNTPLGEGGGLLSGGEGQRVRLARELMRVPRARLVLLDEPFRGLDRDARRRLMEMTRTRWAHATMIVAVHDIEHTLDFSRVLVVDGGRIVEDGRPADLAADSASRYRALLDAEARVRAARWSGALWRRLIVRDGRVWEREIDQ